jgi:hypothetical protein
MREQLNPCKVDFEKFITDTNGSQAFWWVWEQAWEAGRRSSVTNGHALAMRVLQSDLYNRLNDLEKAECQKLICGI